MVRKRIISFSMVLLLCASCMEHQSKEAQKFQDYALLPKKTSIKVVKSELDSMGYKTFNYVNPNSKDTVLMQQYFIAFLKIGPNRSQTKSEADSLQLLHLKHLQQMYDLGYADISGPFGDDGDIRGITIYNVPTLKMADSLANLDPMAKAGRLTIEVHPWWAGKGLPLR